MTRMLHVAGIVIIAFVGVSSFTNAQQSPGSQVETRPGYPTIAQVHVLNNVPADSVSVRVFNTDPVPTTVIGVPTVALTTGTAVEARQVRQRWEYRQIVTVNGTDPTKEFNAAGEEGWEVAGASPSDARHTAWLLKRVR
jgi:hypothetical protein